MRHLSDLADCGWRPNCVSSAASDPRRRVGPWPLAADADSVWRAVREIVAATPRTRIVDEQGFSLRAEARSRIFRFVDDLELLIDSAKEVLAARSAARVGYSDRGVNRRRVLRIARELQRRGLIAS